MFIIDILFKERKKLHIRKQYLRAEIRKIEGKPTLYPQDARKLVDMADEHRTVSQNIEHLSCEIRKLKKKT